MPRMNPSSSSLFAALLARLPRLSVSLLISVLLLVAVSLLAPQQLPVSLYKLSLVTLAGVVGYWLDREMFPYARPDQPSMNLWSTSQELALIMGVSMLRRALIVVGAMLAMGLGA